MVDYRLLNQATKPDAHLLPLIENLLENQSKHKICTVVDLSKDFHQIPLRPEDRSKTAMNLAGGRYQWKVMAMGIENGSAILPRIMDDVMRGIPCANIYIDDIIIGSTGATEEEILCNHERDVRPVLESLRQRDLIASVSKTDLFTRRVQSCGHVLECGTRRPAPGKMLALSEWKRPNKVRELPGFLGLANYYSGNVRRYADLAAPLMDMLKNLPNQPGVKIALHWTALADKSLRELKKAILEVVPLRLADFDKPFVVSPDASDYAVGAALQQRDDSGNLRSLAFHSYKLTKRQLNWPPREEECYAILLALLKWHNWIGLNPVSIETDHKYLESWVDENLETTQGPSPHQAQWHELFSKFDMDVCYVPGPEITPWEIFSHALPILLTLLSRICLCMAHLKRSLRWSAYWLRKKS